MSYSMTTLKMNVVWDIFPLLVDELRLPFKSIYFYTISDPITEEVVYVGKTVDPFSRAKQHCFRPSPELYKWLNLCHSVYKMPPIMHIFDYSDEYQEPKENREAIHIENYIKGGSPLLNKVRYNELLRVTTEPSLNLNAAPNKALQPNC